MSDALPLPPRPDLAQYRKLAKELKEACRSGDPAAIGAWVDRVAPRDADRLLRRWTEFRAAQKHKDPCALTRAQFFLAREHGFASWPKFAEAVEEIAREGSPVSIFENAADAVVAGDIETLRRLLREHPELTTARSAREHRSTLLHYVSANGVEDFRQKTPPNIVEIAALLLDAGADVNAESEAYGGGSDTLGLTATSIHPQIARLQIPLLELLVERGARIRGEHAVKSCLDNGQPEGAQFYAAHGAPLDPQAAAGLGRLDALERFHAQGKLVDECLLYAAGFGRKEAVEFLLDHGIPVDARNDGDQTALHWAAYGGEFEIVRLLLDRGAPLDLRDRHFGGTPLELAIETWANSPFAVDREGAARCIALLVRAGARLDPEAAHSDERRRRAIEKALADPAMSVALGGTPQNKYLSPN